MDRKIRTVAQMESDLDWLSNEYLRGTKNPKELARRLSAATGREVTPITISYDIKKLKQRWRESTEANIEEYRNEALLALEQQEKELWSAWERSKESEKTESEVTGTSSKGGQNYKMKKIKGKVGDATFQKLILQVHERRARLLGLDAPERAEITGEDGSPLFPDKLELDKEHLENFLEKKVADRIQAGFVPVKINSNRS